MLNTLRPDTFFSLVRNFFQRLIEGANERTGALSLVNLWRRFNVRRKYPIRVKLSFVRLEKKF